MTDPTASGAVAIGGAWLSAAVMALLGIEYFALVWGIGGAVFSLTLTRPESRKAAMVSVVTSALAGAALASLLAGMAGGGKPALIAIAFITAAGAKPIVSRGIAAVENLIARLGGDKLGGDKP
jgi:hypothetical protein